MVPRTPLRPIYSNRTYGSELSPYLRGQIYGQARLGASIAKIGQHFNVSKSTIQYTIDQEALRTEGKSRIRIGRPSILSENDRATIIQLIRNDPFILYKEIREQSGLTASDDTLLRMIKSSGYGQWEAKKRPYLKPEHAALRLTWALERRNWTWDDWKKIIWSDECSVEIGKGKRHQWVFFVNHRDEKWKKDHIVTYSKSKNISIMIWGATFSGGCTDLFQMNRDSESARNCCTRASHIARF